MAQDLFGGKHTVQKLRVISDYLEAYQKVLKNTGLTTIYVDAFAGTGEIPFETGELLQDIDDAEPFITGSAKRALSIKTPFHRYIFIEKDSRKAAELKETLSRGFTYLSSRMEFLAEDANKALIDLCSSVDWKKHRAVVFLDPFGNQVGWETLAKIAATKAIDVWYLFPAQLGVCRQISAAGQFDEGKASSLDFIFGTGEWRNEFISTTIEQDLLGQRRRSSKQVDVESATRYMIKRMKEIFAGVVLDVWIPLGRNGSHWYSLLFACSNPSQKATEIANRIASSLMRQK